MDERTGVPVEDSELRDRDVMNLLDQLELYTLRVAGGRISQKDYWKFVNESMKSGLLMTNSMEKHLRYKLRGVGEPAE